MCLAQGPQRSDAGEARTYQETKSAFVWNNSGQPVGDFFPRLDGAYSDLGNWCAFMTIAQVVGYAKCDSSHFYLPHLCERTP